MAHDGQASDEWIGWKGPTQIAWATDLHLDRLPWAEAEAAVRRLVLQARQRSPRPEALVLTGDLATARQLPDVLALLAREIAPGDGSGPLRTYFTLGNHDVWGATFEQVRHQAEHGPSLVRWLPTAGVRGISPTTALVGVDGWYDGTAGAGEATEATLRDVDHITDLQGKTRRERFQAYARLAEAEVRRAGDLIDQAIGRDYRHVVLATHVPPWARAAMYQGRVSTPSVAPYYSCPSLGRMLERVARDHPDRTFTVLCGHAHAAVDRQIRRNLRVLVGEADYLFPTLQPAVWVT